MSEHDGSIHVNQYLQKHMKNYSTYKDLSSEIISKGNLKQRNGKHILTILRELSIFNVPNQSYDVGLVRSLLMMTKDTSSHDIDRKIVRSSYFLLTELVLNAPRDVALDDIAQELMNHLLAEVKTSSDSRLCMAWRLVSRIAYQYQQVDMFKDSLVTIFNRLKYPEKEKRLLLGKKKATQDYENQLHFWTALFSALRRVQLVPPIDSIPIIFLGCKSSHTQLSRHAFYLLKICLDKHPIATCPLFHTALKDSNVLSRASADVHSCIYLMEACKSFIVSLESQASYTHAPIVDTLNYLFMLLSDTNVKIRMECIRLLTEIPPGEMFTKALLTMEVGSPDFVMRMISAIQPSLEDLFVPGTDEEGIAARRGSAANLHVASGKRRVVQPIGFGDVNIGPLCRACIRLGRYVIVHRDALLEGGEQGPQESELLLNEIFKPLAKELFRLMKEFRNSSVFLSHAYCDTLKALLWLLPPDPSEDNKQAIGMYTWFQNQTISALPTLQESLTETVMRHIFGRIEESPATANPDILLNMALKCAEKAVTCFDNTSGQAVGMLIQVWEQFAIRKERISIQRNFLHSLLSAADGSLWQPSSSPTFSSSSAGSRPEQGLLSLKFFAFWALGEYVHIWDSLSVSEAPAGVNISSSVQPSPPPSSAADHGRAGVTSQDPQDLTLDGVMYSFPPGTGAGAGDAVPPLLLVVMTLFSTLQTGEPTVRSVCLESLFKIATYAPVESVLRELIEQELHAMAADTFSIPLPAPLSASEKRPPEDPRSPPSLLAGMQLSSLGMPHGSSSSSSSGGGGSSSSTSLCHPGALWLGSSPASQSSGRCREVLLYSLALQSLRGFSGDCSFPQPRQGTTQPPPGALDTTATVPVTGSNISSPPPPPPPSTDFFGEVDLLGDMLSAPSSSSSSSSSVVSPLMDLMAPQFQNDPSSLGLEQPQEQVVNRLVVAEKAALEDLLVQLNLANFYN